MQVFFKEIKDHLKGLLIWSASTAAFLAIASSEFEGYYQNEEMVAMMQLLPTQLVQAMGMDQVNITVPSGYASLMITFLLIIITIYALLLGSSILIREERDKTAEFLYTMPVKKRWVVMQKILAGIGLNALFNVVIYGGFILIMSRFEFDEKFLNFQWLSALMSFLLALVFYGVGLLLSAVMKQLKKVESVGVGILLVTYILSVVIDLTDKIDFLQYVTPFTYFKPSEVLNLGALDGTFVLLSLGIFVICGVITAVVYPQRDLRL